MWFPDYDRRLASWLDLRAHSKDLPLELALGAINHWWRQSPWQPYYLHWDDRATWPNPWQLLADNVYCDLARALGMLYTKHLVDRLDCTDAILAETDRGNLVQIQQAKYVLNWWPDRIVNIQSETIVHVRTLEFSVLDHLIR